MGKNVVKSCWTNTASHSKQTSQEFFGVFFTASGTTWQQLKASHWRAAEAEASWESSNIFSNQSGLCSFKEERGWGGISLPGFWVAHHYRQPVTSRPNPQLLAVSAGCTGHFLFWFVFLIIFFLIATERKVDWLLNANGD